MSDSDVLATTSDHLRLYRFTEQNYIVSDLKNNFQQELSAPLTSFDWNKVQNHIICCSSIDTTCSIWDTHESKMIKQVITHDKEVLDISFEPSGYEFATVGFDATVRQFDMRDLTKSDIILEHTEPLTRLAFNNFARNILAVTTLDGNSVLILDTRKALEPLMELSYHRRPVNNIVWAPYSRWILCSIGDDMRGLLWNIAAGGPTVRAPMMQYESEDMLFNVAWCNVHNDWIGIVKKDSFNMIKVEIPS